MNVFEVIDGVLTQKQVPLSVELVKKACGFTTKGFSIAMDAPLTFKNGQCVLQDGFYVSADPKWPMLLSMASIESRIESAESSSEHLAQQISEESDEVVRAHLNNRLTEQKHFVGRWKSSVLKILTL